MSRVAHVRQLGRGAAKKTDRAIVENKAAVPSHGFDPENLERFQRFYTAALPKNDCRSPFFVFFAFFVSASFVGLSFDGRLLPSTDKADLGLRRGDIDGLDTA